MIDLRLEADGIQVPQVSEAVEDKEQTQIKEKRLELCKSSRKTRLKRDADTSSKLLTPAVGVPMLLSLPHAPAPRTATAHLRMCIGRGNWITTGHG